MKNLGKRFEENFKRSIPKGIFYYRLKDNSNTWSNGDKTRFTPTNICDSIMFDGFYLYMLELKSTKGKSLPYSNIREHQINDLLWCDTYENVISGLVIEFSDYNECYFIEISRFKVFKDSSDRKSLPIEFCKNNGIKIDVEKLKTNSRFNIERFIHECAEKVL